MLFLVGFEGWLPVDMTEDTSGLPQHKSQMVQECAATEEFNVLSAHLLFFL